MTQQPQKYRIGNKTLKRLTANAMIRFSSQKKELTIKSFTISEHLHRKLECNLKQLLSAVCKVPFGIPVAEDVETSVSITF